MRILLWAPGGAGTHYWGPGMSAFRLYQHIDKNQISISLAHGYRNQKNYDLFDNQYFISDLSDKGLLASLQFLLNAKKWIRENAHKFDIVHCLTDYHNSFMPALWFEQHGVKAVIKVVEAKAGFVRSSFISEIFGLRKYRIRHANIVSAYITLSREMDRDLLSAGIENTRIHRLQNGVDIERFRPVNKKTKENLRKSLRLEDKFTVIFTGGFNARKNPSMVIEAFKNSKYKTNIQFLLIGPDRDDGKEREKCEKIIKEYGMKNVLLLDFVQKIEKFYMASDVFVLPSVNEGMSNSMLEAQSSGLPAVVTKISGAEDIIDERKNGTFVELNPDSIKRAIESYYLNPEKLSEHSSGARSYVFQNNRSEIVLQKHMELFEALTGLKK